MPSRPNVLFLMTDQMQGRVLEPDHPCRTPNFDRLASQGVRFRRAYTPNAVCSPARASLMTGLLPHNHGVLTVTHVVDDDQSCLRTDRPHWAQRLRADGYRTAYFGKWHVERSHDLDSFGWETYADEQSGIFRTAKRPSANPERDLSIAGYCGGPAGYQKGLLYGVTDVPPEERPMGVVTQAALDHLDEVLDGEKPWCVFVSVQEPHDPFVAGREAFDLYDPDLIELPPNARDELAGRPGIYRKVAQVWKDMTDRQRREAAACYYATITEIDAQFGRLIDRVREAGSLDDTVVVVTTDHGEALSAHGLYCKNFSAAEEIYNIPLVVAGPGLARGAVTQARVGLHDLCPTLLELVGAEPIDVPDSRSFASVLRDPAGREGDYATGFAEFYGGRMIVTQRVVWDGPWKFVFNGFDFDELYNLDDDPYEMSNLAEEPACAGRLRQMTAQMWRAVRDTGDMSLLNSHYPCLRVAPYGPRIIEDD